MVQVAYLLFHASFVFSGLCAYLSHMLSISNSITGGPSGANKKPRAPRPRYLPPGDEGQLVDEVLIRQRADQAARDKVEERKRKAALRRNKGKDTRVNYKEIDSVEYATMRQSDWYVKPLEIGRAHV